MVADLRTKLAKEKHHKINVIEYLRLKYEVSNLGIYYKAWMPRWFLRIIRRAS